jgi:hypothetical protein
MNPGLEPESVEIAGALSAEIGAGLMVVGGSALGAGAAG